MGTCSESWICNKCTICIHQRRLSQNPGSRIGANRKAYKHLTDWAIISTQDDDDECAVAGCCGTSLVCDQLVLVAFCVVVIIISPPPTTAQVRIEQCVAPRICIAENLRNAYIIRTYCIMMRCGASRIMKCSSISIWARERPHLISSGCFGRVAEIPWLPHTHCAYVLNATPQSYRDMSKESNMHANYFFCLKWQLHSFFLEEKLSAGLYQWKVFLYETQFLTLNKSK